MKRILYFMIGCFFVLVFAIVLLYGCGEDVEIVPNYYPVNEETFVIETDYCDLEYLTEWEDDITIEKGYIEDIYTVSFYYDDKLIFDISFNGPNDCKIGVLELDGEQIDVCVESYSIDNEAYSEETYMKLCSMQEDVNVIITRLVEKYGLVM